MTIEDAPLVSILIRSMDRPTLDRAIASAVSQTWPNVEIVVVAACGSVHRALPTPQNGRDVRLIVRDRTLPRPEAANVALESARGDWLNFLDDDDELMSTHVETLMNARANARIVYSRAQVRDRDGKPTGFCGVPFFPSRFRYDTPTVPNAMMFQRSLVEEGARFDPDFAVYEDHDFFINLAARAPMRFVDVETCVWNAHDGESGLGHGVNSGIGRRGELSERIRTKWSAQFDAWDNTPGSLLQAGQALLTNGDIVAAHDALERALRQTPNDVNALNLCGMANLHNGNAERAEQLVTAALKRAPASAALRENLALIRERRAKAP
jgi:glycosyltransferase involved in cell wall biosynthesis